MKIHYFRIDIQGSSRAVSDLVDDIGARPQAERERRIHDKDVFLEHYSRTNGLYEMEFTQRRTQNGPGHSMRGKSTVDFTLSPDAGFGEQAAAIWSPKGYLAVQYNHHSVRPFGIRAYLEEFLLAGPRSTFDPPEVVLEPVLDSEAYARLYRSQKQSRLELAVHADKVTDEMAANNVALGAALEMHNRMEGSKVEIAVSLGGGRRGGPLRNTLDTITSLLRFDESLSKCKVTIKEDPDTATEVLDLLEHRETAMVRDGELQMTPGRRFTYASRIAAIRKRFEPWLSRR